MVRINKNGTGANSPYTEITGLDVCCMYAGMLVKRLVRVFELMKSTSEAL